MPFREIESIKTKAMYVAEQILDAIKKGEYSIGSKLPPERRIAEQMKVSRNSVREALRALQIIGIIESKAGMGTYVSGSVEKGIDLSTVVAFVEESRDLFEVWEARQELEISLASLASTKATKSDIDNISVALEEMRTDTAIADNVKYLEANRLFHLSVAEAAHNSVLMETLQPLIRVTNQQLLDELGLGYTWQKERKDLDTHEKIFNAIRGHDNRAASEAVRLHFDLLDKYRKEGCGDLEEAGDIP